ncbi:MAG TPA: VanZ family protein [Chitinophagaceae bacterium]|nr:VanZ family protein [Chitinophagaceae bacterium]
MILSARIRLSLALLYFLIISFLFCLPGSVLPKEDWLSKIYFDKWVHIGFFAVLVVLWLWALLPSKKVLVWLLLAAAAVYGITVEIVQDQFIPNRSFDIGDWMADMTGSFIGLWFWNRYIKK